MAGLSNKGTVVSMKTSELPVGYVKPTVVTFTDEEYKFIKDFSVLKVTVDNATKITTMDNIIADATIGITKQITDMVTADYDIVANTVDVWAEILDMKLNADGANPDDDFYNDTVISYVVTVRYYVKTS